MLLWSAVIWETFPTLILHQYGMVLCPLLRPCAWDADVGFCPCLPLLTLPYTLSLTGISAILFVLPALDDVQIKRAASGGAKQYRLHAWRMESFFQELSVETFLPLQPDILWRTNQQFLSCLSAIPFPTFLCLSFCRALLLHPAKCHFRL